MTPLEIHVWSRSVNQRTPPDVIMKGRSRTWAYLHLASDGPLDQTGVKTLSLMLRTAIEGMQPPGLTHVVADFYIAERVPQQLMSSGFPHPFRRDMIKLKSYREAPHIDGATNLKIDVGWYARSIWLRGHDVKSEGDASARVTAFHAWQYGAWWAGDNTKPDGPQRAFPVRVD